MTLAADIVEQLRAQSPLEVLAVGAAIFYLVLAIRQNIFCWLFAAISTAAYVWVFFEARLYMESLLNAFYFAMAGYGWLVWQDGRTDQREKPVVTWPIRVHLLAITAILSLGSINGYLLCLYTDAAFPVVDSLTTGFAFWATFLVARKVLENWWYWLLIDLALIFVFWSRDLQLSSLLYVVYAAMIPFGLAAWSRSMRGRVDRVGR